MAQKDGWALPPMEKVYEALSAIADGRVKMADGRAVVSSSDYNKEYTVEWNEDVYSSSDNASYWQGYMGYPLIAVLMIQGKIAYDKSIPDFFKDINWKALNAEYKNDYARAAGVILERLSASGTDTERIKEEAGSIYGQLSRLSLRRRRGPAPPKSKH